MALPRALFGVVGCLPRVRTSLPALLVLLMAGILVNATDMRQRILVVTTVRLLMTEGARLSHWRNALPRIQKGPISAKSLAGLLDWEPTRWWNLEQKDAWGAFQRDEVAAGVREIAGRLDVDAPTVNACVAFVLDGAPEPPLGPWRDGMAPLARMGRPKGTGRALNRPRVLPRDDGPDDPGPQAARPIIPATLRRTQVDAVLRALEDGEVDRGTALALVVDIYEPLGYYYNKTDRQAPGVA